jgi:hypothetical protein
MEVLSSALSGLLFHNILLCGIATSRTVILIFFATLANARGAFDLGLVTPTIFLAIVLPCKELLALAFVEDREYFIRMLRRCVRGLEDCVEDKIDELML